MHYAFTFISFVVLFILNAFAGNSATGGWSSLTIPTMGKLAAH